MRTVEFNHIADHGVEETTVFKYPWKRWMNGATWGFEPEHFGTSPKSFKRRLRKAARESDMAVDISELRIDDRLWVLFTFDPA